MGTFSCEKGVFSDLSTIARAGPAIMSKIVLRDDILVSLHVSAKLALMELKFETCELTILDYPPKTVHPNITVGTNGIALMLSISGKPTECNTKVQKSSLTLFSDMSVATGTEPPNTMTDGFLTGLLQGNQAEITTTIQKAIYASLGKALNDAKICNLFREYLS
ncbi:hypothetical protein GE061_007008 [Apolygus lucorum]|uniref:Lipid-binding serum glycoprotein N-terminal domain-containing protein n=1 Tax=Apolygus lucorum TaxID=248454 RepID=A0A6A4IIB7_APOLU|nr:hypothetical protein GE061_007008 [Apolygus lucorum]